MALEKNKRALVLGATGMIGGALARDLAKESWKVFGAARLARKSDVDALRADNIEPVRYDAFADDPTILPDVDAVFLEIWKPSQPELQFKLNYYEVGRVVERYSGKADIINGCTINVYGDHPEIRSENDPFRPGTDYALSRYCQERLIDFFSGRNGKGAIHVRYAHANTGNEGVLPWMVGCILNKKTLGPNPDRRIQVIALEDIVRMTHLAAAHVAPEGRAVNCCHPRVWSFRELAATLHRLLGSGQVIFDRKSGGQETSAYADTKFMIELFGPPTVPLEQLFDKVVRHARGQLKGGTNE